MPITATHHDETLGQHRHLEQDTRMATWCKVVGVVPMPFVEMIRPFFITEVIATATPDFLRDAIHEGHRSHLRIASGAPQGWLEYACEDTLNQAERVILERNIRAPEDTTHDPDLGELRNTQESCATTRTADPQGHIASSPQQDDDNEQGPHTSTSSEPRGRSRAQNHEVSTAHHRDPQGKHDTEQENIPEPADGNPQSKRATGPRNERRRDEILPPDTTTQRTHTTRKNPQEHHNTSTTGAASLSQFTRRNIHTRARRRTASTSPQRSDAGSDTDHSRTASTSPQRSDAGNNTVHNIDTTVIGLNGDTITMLKLNSNDSSLSVGHLYHHTKGNLHLSENNFALVIGTHKLDDLSARFFNIRAIKNAIQTSPDSNISLTMIRVARKTEIPANLASGPPIQRTEHRNRAPVLDDQNLAALNLMAGRGRPNAEFATYTSAARRLISTEEMRRDAAAFRAACMAEQRAAPIAVDQQQINRPMDTRTRADPVGKEQLETTAAASLMRTPSTSHADTLRDNNTLARHAQSPTPQTQTGTDINTRQQRPELPAAPTLNMDDKTGPHNIADETQAHNTETPARGNASEEPHAALAPGSASTTSEQHIPNTTWFKVVGTLPMPWFECPHPLSIDDVTRHATPEGCSQPASEGPCCHLRIISGAAAGWLCHADVASFKVGAQIILQRSIRAAGGAKHTGLCGDKDMLRDLDDPEHQPIPRKQTKYSGPQYSKHPSSEQEPNLGRPSHARKRSSCGTA